MICEGWETTDDERRTRQGPARNHPTQAPNPAKREERKREGETKPPNPGAKPQPNPQNRIFKPPSTTFEITHNKNVTKNKKSVEVVKQMLEIK